jgi:hypothetical protein
MSVILNKYKNNIDYCFYESGNIEYSECIDKENEYKDLTVIFKDGRCYNYKEVDVNDYVKFKNAVSNGKALNEHIIGKDRKNPKYNTLRLPDKDLNTLNIFKKELLEELGGNAETTTFETYKDKANGKIFLYKNGLQIFGGRNGEFILEDVLNALEIQFTEKVDSELISEEI